MATNCSDDFYCNFCFYYYLFRSNRSEIIKHCECLNAKFIKKMNIWLTLYFIKMFFFFLNLDCDFSKRKADDFLKRIDVCIYSTYNYILNWFVCYFVI